MKVYLIGSLIVEANLWVGNIIREDGKNLGEHGSSSQDFLKSDLTDKIKDDGYEIIDLIGKRLPVEVVDLLKLSGTEPKKVFIDDLTNIEEVSLAVLARRKGYLVRVQVQLWKDSFKDFSSEEDAIEFLKTQKDSA